METTRLQPGLYRIESKGKTYYVEEVGSYAIPSRKQWNISCYLNNNGVLHREVIDATDTLKDAKYLISCYEG